MTTNKIINRLIVTFFSILCFSGINTAKAQDVTDHFWSCMHSDSGRFTWSIDYTNLNWKFYAYGENPDDKDILIEKGSIPYDEIRAYAELKDKKRKIIIACASGKACITKKSIGSTTEKYSNKPLKQFVIQFQDLVDYNATLETMIQYNLVRYLNNLNPNLRPLSLTEISEKNAWLEKKVINYSINDTSDVPFKKVLSVPGTIIHIKANGNGSFQGLFENYSGVYFFKSNEPPVFLTRLHALKNPKNEKNCGIFKDENIIRFCTKEEVIKYNTKSGKIERIKHPVKNVSTAMFDPNGLFAFLYNEEEQTIYIYDIYFNKLAMKIHAKIEHIFFGETGEYCHVYYPKKKKHKTYKLDIGKNVKNFMPNVKYQPKFSLSFPWEYSVPYINNLDIIIEVDINEDDYSRTATFFVRNKLNEDKTRHFKLFKDEKETSTSIAFFKTANRLKFGIINTFYADGLRHKSYVYLPNKLIEYLDSKFSKSNEE